MTATNLHLLIETDFRKVFCDSKNSSFWFSPFPSVETANDEMLSNNIFTLCLTTLWKLLPIKMKFKNEKKVGKEKISYFRQVLQSQLVFKFQYWNYVLRGFQPFTLKFTNEAKVFPAAQLLTLLSSYGPDLVYVIPSVRIGHLRLLILNWARKTKIKLWVVLLIPTSKISCCRH